MKLLKHLSYCYSLKRMKQQNNIQMPVLKRFQVYVFGTGNTVFIAPEIKHLSGYIRIYGNNNTVYIQKGYDMKLNIDIGSSVTRTANECLLTIGKNLYCGMTHIMIGENHSILEIGDDCMFSDNIDIYATDGHTVLNLNNEITNIGHSVRIKNHVWLGKDVKIGKNTLISDNSIVGWGAVVTKKFTQNNIIIAGNPASVVKKGVNWDRAFPNSYINRKS